MSQPVGVHAIHDRRCTACNEPAWVEVHMGRRQVTVVALCRACAKVIGKELA